MNTDPKTPLEAVLAVLFFTGLTIAVVAMWLWKAGWF